jgi:hypothetical protein
MITDRRAILSLIAMGRITPREAERLLAVWSDRDEVVVWLAVIAATLCLLLPDLHEIFAGLSHALEALSPRFLTAGHHAAALVSLVFGGKS